MTTVQPPPPDRSPAVRAPDDVVGARSLPALRHAALEPLAVPRRCDPHPAAALPALGDAGHREVAEPVRAARGGSVSPRDAAVAAARRGWAVFPCRPGDKRPATPGHAAADCDGTDPRCRGGHTGWEARATTDTDRIRRGWTKPYNIGIACGPSRLVVVDLDTPRPEKGKVMPEEWEKIPGIITGADVLSQVCEWAGTDWPSTFTVHTPSGGDHLYFRAPGGSSFRNTQSVIGPLIDTRANGGYVVGAGSIVGGKTYEVTDDQEPAELPRWLARFLAAPEPEHRPAHAPADTEKRLSGLTKKVSESQPGTRTRVLVWAAFKLGDMIRDGSATELDGEELVSAAVAAGIDGGEKYARSQVRSVLRRTA